MIGGGRLAVPRWIDLALIPLVNLMAALLLAGVVVLIVGEDPVLALRSLVWGAFGSWQQTGFTLYYATSFIFTGLAVAVAFHCGLFNIGGEGQAALGGLGVGLVCLGLADWPFLAVLATAILAAALFGAAWAAIPGYLQAKRGSHVVITTIMFNFLAAILLNYLLVEVLIEPGQQAPRTRRFEAVTWLPLVHQVLAGFGIAAPRSPLNLSFLWALLCCAGLWIFLWRTRWGYELRAVGLNQTAARYAGISPARNIVLAMAIGGALAGFVGLNEIMGVQHRLLLGFTGGVGFAGIAVAQMGRNHPVGIVLAALLFGGLYQGGSELAFDIPTFTRDMVVVIQGLVILFCGALENIFRSPIEAIFKNRRPLPAVAG